MADALLDAGFLDDGPAATGEGIGPGRFVMVIGPSGAGKDSLICAARDAFAGDEHFVFPQRFITRPSSPSENNVEISAAVFEALHEAGGFAASWRAHGLGYGLPRAIDDDIAKGRTVICNVSRTLVPKLRERFVNTVAIEVTAPPDILAARLAARRRGDDGPVDLRLRRSASIADVRPDAVIPNGGDLSAATSAFIEALR